MGFFDGPPFDFNGNGKMDFHEFMIVAEGMRQQENDDLLNSNYNIYSDDNNNSDDNSDW